MGNTTARHEPSLATPTGASVRTLRSRTKVSKRQTYRAHGAAVPPTGTRDPAAPKAPRAAARNGWHHKCWAEGGGLEGQKNILGYYN